MVTRAPRALAQNLCIGAYSINAVDGVDGDAGDAVVFGDVDHSLTPATIQASACDVVNQAAACDLRKCSFMAKQPEVAVARVDTAILRCHCLSLAVLPQGITQ
jgi:hypothetical protein